MTYTYKTPDQFPGHYGDQDLIRPDYLQALKEIAELVNRVATTSAHPAAQHLTWFWNRATNAELRAAGLLPPKQLKLEL